MEEYVYGYPLVMMDVTNDVISAASTSGEYAAPMNQFARLREYVGPSVVNVVRISVNSLWSHGFLDLDAEPMIVSLPDMGDRYIVMQALNMWTEDFASVGTRTNGAKRGLFDCRPEVDGDSAGRYRPGVSVLHSICVGAGADVGW